MYEILFFGANEAQLIDKYKNLNKACFQLVMLRIILNYFFFLLGVVVLS